MQPTGIEGLRVEAGDWRLRFDAAVWTDELAQRVMTIVAAQPPAKHPQTIAVELGSCSEPVVAFLKVFHPAAGWATWKNWLRRSKAFHAWHQAHALVAAGFHAPAPIAAGEARRYGRLHRSFILSRRVPGQGLPDFLRSLARDGAAREIILEKRSGIRRLASEIGRLHRTGFVHGDLVATNLFVARSASGAVEFYFMDNDRTRRYPSWLARLFQKRNLVQLNRLPLPGITLQDRMRFFRVYFGVSGRLKPGERRLAQWFENKTRQRRKECDGIAPTAGFRELMRWTGN